MVAGTEVDVHAVHIPNGIQHGWAKIDHLNALRSAFGEARERPQILCGDFNTPWAEIDGRIITAAQHPSGALRERSRSRAISPDRPWNAEEWDRGERGVLEGLPRECGMPDAFNVRHPGKVEATWVKGRLPDERGRRLDHVFASEELAVVECNHVHSWRRQKLSDHSAIEVVFRLPGPERGTT